MDIWSKIKPILTTQNIEIKSLTPSLMQNNATLLPHLLDHIDEDVVLNALQEAGVIGFNKDEFDVKHVGSSYTITTRKSDKSDEKDAIIFCKNPFDESIIFQAKTKAKQISLHVEEIGFITEQDFCNLINKTSKVLAAHSEKHKKMLSEILSKAIKNNVSDVHIVYRNKNGIAIFFRQFGDIKESGITDIAMNDYAQFSNGLIDLAGGDGGNYRQYKESQFNYQTLSFEISSRLQQNPLVYTFPGSDADTIPSFVIRLHNKSASFKSIDDIGFLPDQKELLKAVAQHNSGLIIVSGPTGSGKTTALYSILIESISKKRRVVRTIEDPVEIVIENDPLVVQTNINKAAGITYESTINESILRSDVDVCLVGEIRSKETALGVLSLDRVGHLMFATVHTKKTVSIIDRLREFGAENVNISDALSVILSTRLTKKVCPHCSQESDTVSVLRKFEKVDFEELTPEQIKTRKSNKLLLAKLKVGEGSKYTGSGGIGLTDKLAVINEKGCDKCVEGYYGRQLVAEVWAIDNVIREMININATNTEIEHQILQHDNKSIWDHGFELVKEGLTTIEALESVLPQFISFGNNYSANEAHQL